MGRAPIKDVGLQLIAELLDRLPQATLKPQLLNNNDTKTAPTNQTVLGLSGTLSQTMVYRDMVYPFLTLHATQVVTP